MEDSKSTRLDLFDNSDHRPGSLIKRYAWHIINLVFFSSGIHISSVSAISLKRVTLIKLGLVPITIRSFINFSVCYKVGNSAPFQPKFLGLISMRVGGFYAPFGLNPNLKY